MNWCVYLAPSLSGDFKIGVSQNPMRRLKQLDKDRLFNFQAVVVLDVGSQRDAFQLESVFHRVLSKYNIKDRPSSDGRTEWFRGTGWQAAGHLRDTLKSYVDFEVIPLAYRPYRPKSKGETSKGLSTVLRSYISRRRKQLGIKTQELCDACGLARSTYCRFINQNGNISFDSLLRILSKLKIDEEIERFLLEKI